MLWYFYNWKSTWQSETLFNILVNIISWKLYQHFVNTWHLSRQILTHKQLERHGCELNAVATYALVLSSMPPVSTLLIELYVTSFMQKYYIYNEVEMISFEKMINNFKKYLTL